MGYFGWMGKKERERGEEFRGKYRFCLTGLACSGMLALGELDFAKKEN